MAGLADIHELKDILDVPEDVWAALQILTAEELNKLRAFWNLDRTFWGIGFVGPGGKACKYADKRRRDACDIIEAQYRREMGLIERTVLRRTSGLPGIWTAPFIDTITRETPRAIHYDSV